MRVVLRECADAHQAVQRSRQLVPVDEPSSPTRMGRSLYDHIRRLKDSKEPGQFIA
jgi:hypothetical protein